MQQIPQPTQPFERIGSLDFLRGVALLGILIINIESFTYPDPWSPYKYGFWDPWDHNTRFWVYFLAQGKFFSMFTLLFGASFYIFLERLEQKGIGLKALDIYARRLLWLFIFGAAHAYLLWDGDVLYHYAVCGFLLFPFRSFTIRSLLLILLIPIATLLLNSYNRVTATQKQYAEFIQASKIKEGQQTDETMKKIQRWESRTKKKSALDSEVQVPRKTYFQSVLTNAEHTKVHKGAVLYQGILFRTLIMMILGIILYKSGIFLNYQSVKYYWPIAITLLLVALVINYTRYYHWSFEYFHPVKSIWKSWLFTFPKELSGLAYVLVLNGLYQKYLASVKLKLISNIGRMALTNYIMQSMICGFIFYGYGLGRYNHYSRFELLSIVAIIWCLQLFLSWWWLKKFRQGPLEWCWRKLTYGNIQQV
ncbi:DUF418 domain-containing protein [Fulvivirga sp. M361]|uniref:DUF418 domain-containing protein n=1 Tax=Fulvivirga sp. M361 TaxID=2594266 RepID=UPI00117A34E7|nr:DUF418 domain-containing protein [Fulvivirga sp. M361]TRX61417.1 DUF418 domain-containing protein [Fulvivirga sp. M361]